METNYTNGNKKEKNKIILGIVLLALVVSASAGVFYLGKSFSKEVPNIPSEEAEADYLNLSWCVPGSIIKKDFGVGEEEFRTKRSVDLGRNKLCEIRYPDRQGGYIIDENNTIFYKIIYNPEINVSELVMP